MPAWVSRMGILGDLSLSPGDRSASGLGVLLALWGWASVGRACPASCFDEGSSSDSEHPESSADLLAEDHFLYLYLEVAAGICSLVSPRPVPASYCSHPLLAISWPLVKKQGKREVFCVWGIVRADVHG